MEGEPKSYCVLRSVLALHVLNRPASNLSARSTESDPSTTRASPPGGGLGQRHPSAEPNPTPRRGPRSDEGRGTRRRSPRGEACSGGPSGSPPGPPHAAPTERLTGTGPDDHMEAHLGGLGADRGPRAGASGPLGATSWGPSSLGEPHTPTGVPLPSSIGRQAAGSGGGCPPLECWFVREKPGEGLKHERTLLHVRTSPDGRSEETLAEPPSSDVVPDRVYHVTDGSASLCHPSLHPPQGSLVKPQCELHPFLPQPADVQWAASLTDSALSPAHLQADWLSATILGLDGGLALSTVARAATATIHPHGLTVLRGTDVNTTIRDAKRASTPQ
ncbi:unnamed protein product [Boreogadus saida]